MKNLQFLPDEFKVKTPGSYMNFVRKVKESTARKE